MIAGASGGPLAGRCIDLNVMARRGRCSARVRRCRSGRAVEFTAATTVLFALGAPESLKAGAHGALDRLDALRFAAPWSASLESPRGAPLTDRDLAGLAR